MKSVAVIWAMGLAAALTLAAQPASRAQQAPPAKRPADPQPAGEKKSPADAPREAKPKSPPAAGAGTVRTLRLPELEPDLPDAPGRKTVIVACGVCHSTRYITIQPPLSRETWVAEVTKMQKTFGGPIPEDKVGEILDYLVAVRGPQPK